MAKSKAQQETQTPESSYQEHGQYTDSGIDMRQRIAERAYEIYQERLQRGDATSDEISDWCRAEQELKAQADSPAQELTQARDADSPSAIGYNE